jgi:GNAT superfamily N-acetyltransferase
MTYQIVPIAEEHISGFHAAIDVVARERRYLAHLEAPPFEETRRFVLGNIEHGYPQFAVVSADTVVGWCDVLPNRYRVIYSHCGTLGVGLVPEFRGKGIGRQLMRRTIDAAFAFGLTRIELTVREGNATEMPSTSRDNTKIYTRWPCRGLDNAGRSPHPNPLSASGRNRGEGGTREAGR